MRLRPSVVPALLAVAVLAGAAHAAAPRPSPEEAAALSSASDLRLSPDGRTVVYALATHALDAAAKPAEDDHDAGWTNRRQLWLADLTTGATRALTTAQSRAGSPRWSPDGREIAFLREHDGKVRIHVMPLGGGEPEVVSTGALVPTSLDWTPDGRALVFTAADSLEAREKDEKWRTGGVVHWDAEWRPEQLWEVPRAGGPLRRVTRGPTHVVEWALAPDGERAFVLTSDSADPYEASNLLTARLVSTKDGAVLRTLAGPGPLEHPRWSPDGRHVAWLAVREGLSLFNSLMVADAETGAARDLSPSLDPSFETFEWAPDSRSLVAVVDERTGTRLWRLAAAGGAPADLGLEGRVLAGDLGVAPNGATIAFLSSTDEEPADPTAFDVGSRAARVVARLDPQVGSWALGRTEVVRWTGPEGTALEGLLTVPANQQRGTLPPLVVMPHGGPDGVSARSFSPIVQFLAAHGYAVFRPNYRGGIAYGHAFYAANRNRFGTIETMDIESGVDALIAARRVDPRELFYGGWSWGGYLSAWTLGHVHRYRAHVVGAGVNDVVLSYGLSDINHGVAAEWEYEGNPWRQREHFDRADPLRAIAGATSPTLVLQGEEDGRVPFAQSVLLYRALKDVGCPVEFYAYPREDHGFVEPAHLAHRYAVWLDWYERHRASMVTSPPPARRAAGMLH